MAALKVAPLRAIRATLSKPHSKLEPVLALLECGHKVTARPNGKRARCKLCAKQPSRLPSVGQPIRAVKSVPRPSAEERIFVALEGSWRQAKRKGREYRVLRLALKDETPGDGGRPFNAMPSIRIACHASAVSYVKARLLELAEELDGVIVVT